MAIGVYGPAAIGRPEPEPWRRKPCNLRPVSPRSLPIAMEVCAANPCNPCAGHQFGRIQPTMRIDAAGGATGRRGARARELDGWPPRERIRAAASRRMAFLAGRGHRPRHAAPDERTVDHARVLGLVVGYALVSRVRFEFGDTYVCPSSSLFVPMLVLAPLPRPRCWSPRRAVLAVVPDFVRGTWHWDRTIGHTRRLLVLRRPRAGARCARTRARRPSTSRGPTRSRYIAQLAGDLAWALIRDHLARPRPDARRCSASSHGIARVDAILAPVAFVDRRRRRHRAARAAGVGPLVWLLEIFSTDRRERYGADARAEPRLPRHGDAALRRRRVRRRVHRRALPLGRRPRRRRGGRARTSTASDRQELEFAAMLHDVGKISIPKEILQQAGRSSRARSSRS